MKPTRRAFVTTLAGLGLLPTTVMSKGLGSGLETSVSTAPPHAPDGWSYHWRDYHFPANQVIGVGYWSAWHTSLGTSCLLAPTSGIVQRVEECHVFDTTHERSWPYITVHSSAEQREVVKQRAHRALEQAVWQFMTGQAYQ